MNGSRATSSRTTLVRALRRDATEAEKRLWGALREAGMPWRIRRQHPVGRFIVDFAVPSRNLVIEIDGGQHVRQAEADAARTDELQASGWRVVRFWNHDVLQNADGVVAQIVRALRAEGGH